MMFSSRTNWNLSSNALHQSLEELKQKNVKIIDLTKSNPTQCEFSYPDKVIDALSNNQNLNYEASAQGLLSARQAVVDYYKKRGQAVDIEKLFLTASTSEAYSYLFRLLCDVNDEVLIPSPSYPLFHYLAEINDVNAVTYSLDYNQEWRINFDEFEKQVTPRCKAVILVNPNNPTGSYVKKEERAAINAFCQKHNLAIICDEVFYDYAFTNDEQRSSSFVGNDQVLTFTLNGLSKALALPQMKISWMVMNGPRREVEKAKERLEVIADTFLSVNASSQNALPTWLSHDQAIQSQIKERAITNDATLKKVLGNEHVLNTEGGWNAIIRFPEQKDEEDWSLELLSHHHVYVYPGYYFDFKDLQGFVVSLLPSEDEFESGMKKIKLFL